MFVSRLCYKSGSLKVIVQCNHDGIGCETRVKLSSVISRLLLVKSVLPLSWSVGGPFVGFIYVADKVQIVVDIF